MNNIVEKMNCHEMVGGLIEMYFDLHKKIPTVGKTATWQNMTAVELSQEFEKYRVITAQLQEMGLTTHPRSVSC